MNIVRRESASETTYLVCTIAKPGPRAPGTFTNCLKLKQTHSRENLVANHSFVST